MTKRAQPIVRTTAGPEGGRTPALAVTGASVVLADLGEYLDAHGLEVAGGDPDLHWRPTDERPWSPVLYLRRKERDGEST